VDQARDQYRKQLVPVKLHEIEVCQVDRAAESRWYIVPFEDEIRAGFDKGWQIDSIEPAKLDSRMGPDGILAWLARITRK
jgi:hypothetical protein